MTRDADVVVPMRDRINFLADVHRPAEPGRLSCADRSIDLSAAGSEAWLDNKPCAKPATQLCALSKIQAAQDNAGRSAFEFHCKKLASGTLFDPIAQRLGQRGDGELLLVAQDRTNGTKAVPNTR
jgi:hypothetical protein